VEECLYFLKGLYGVDAFRKTSLKIYPTNAARLALLAIKAEALPKDLRKDRT
jgi:hypothetical protein